MRGDIKIYSDLGSIVIEIPTEGPKTFTTQSALIASNSGNKVTVKFGETNVFFAVPYTQIKKRGGGAWGSTGSAVKNALNDLFSDANPSGFALDSDIEDLRTLIKRITQSDDDSDGGTTDGDGDSGGGGDVWVISVDGDPTSGKVKVRENSSLMRAGDSEMYVDKEQIRFSVKSNTGNLGSEVKSEAIVITGEESTTDSSVDMRGTLKLSKPSESKFVMTNTLSTNGKTTYSGNASWLTLPEAADYSNNLMVGKSVIIGNADDTTGRGPRNYFDVRGLSSGDVVDVEVEMAILCDSSHTLLLDDSRTNQSSSVFTATDGLQNVTISMSNTVDNYSDIRYYLSLNTGGSGNYRVTSITVTIS